MSRKIIAVSANLCNDRINIRPEYANALIEAGASPYIIPVTTHPEVLRDTMQHAQALLLTGGGDIDTTLFNTPLSPLASEVCRERDQFEMQLLDIALSRHIPIMGICRGIQIINMALGGSIYQDLATDRGAEFECHRQTAHTSEGTHLVTFTPGSEIAKLMGVTSLMTNSHHHQALNVVAPTLTVTGTCTDGTIEAVENIDMKLVAVQFHPERMTHSTPACHALFTNWIESL